MYSYSPKSRQRKWLACSVGYLIVKTHFATKRPYKYMPLIQTLFRHLGHGGRVPPGVLSHFLYSSLTNGNPFRYCCGALSKSAFAIQNDAIVQQI